MNVTRKIMLLWMILPMFAAISVSAKTSAGEQATRGSTGGIDTVKATEELEYGVNVVKGSEVLLNTTMRSIPGQPSIVKTNVFGGTLYVSLMPDRDDTRKVTVSVQITHASGDSSALQTLVLPLGDGRLIHVGPWTVQVTRFPIHPDR